MTYKVHATLLDWHLNVIVIGFLMIDAPLFYYFICVACRIFGRPTLEGQRCMNCTLCSTIWKSIVCKRRQQTPSSKVKKKKHLRRLSIDHTRLSWHQTTAQRSCLKELKRLLQSFLSFDRMKSSARLLIKSDETKGNLYT